VSRSPATFGPAATCALIDAPDHPAGVASADREQRLAAIVRVPWSEATEAAAVAAGHVGISWMPDNLWSRGKRGLKVLQYLAAGLPVVANPVGIHYELIESGRTGFLARTPSEWAEALTALAAGPDLRARMGRAARDSVARRFSPSRWAPEFRAAVSA
jgi:glycosyltransferase involved in cell wall biosynthesis